MDDITEGIRRIRRIGTQAERIAANPILELGEIAGEIDTGVLYVGDGVTHVNDLPGTATGTSASAVLIKGSDTYANITAIVSPTDGDLWIQTDDAGGGLAGDGLLWDGSAWVNIGQIRGPAGAQGDPGPTGLSAYEEAVVGGFIGTESEWLESLVGADGAPGAGIPIGGDVGSIPTKASETDYDLAWSTPDEVVDPIVGEHAASGHIGLADADFGGFGAKNVKQVVSTSLTIPYAAAVAIDVAGGPAAQSIILTGDTTVTVSGGEVDTYSAVVFEVVQDETGGHAVTWAGVSEWHNGVSTIDPTADSHSFITFLAFGSRVVGVTGFDLSPYLLAEANGATLTDLGGVTNRVSTVLSSGAARTLNMGLFTTFDVTMSAD
ncbi:MAG: hypothetical protein KDB37_14265, partial [Ilumatobacter sp.]|nr:hypothetical protein [Ilumatobacter sp.]